MAESNGWVIQGEKGGGTLSSASRRIVWGAARYAKARTEDWCRIDLTKMEHGSALDTPEHTVPRFIAAADRLHQLLAASSATPRTVTVHCAAGRSRTSITLVVYLVRHAGFSWADAAALVTAGQAERAEYEQGFTFDLERKGVTGSYADWVKGDGLLASKDTQTLMNAYTYVQMDGNKTVYVVEPPQDPLKRRKKRRAPSTPRVSVEDVAPPPRKKPRVHADEVAMGEADRFLRGSRPEPGIHRSGFKRY